MARAVRTVVVGCVLAAALVAGADEPLGLLLNYLQHERDERPLNTDVAALVGLPPSEGPYAGKRKAYDDGRHSHVIYLLTQRGRIELVMLVFDATQMRAYLASASGALVRAAHEREDGFRRELAYWMNQAETWNARP